NSVSEQNFLRLMILTKPFGFAVVFVLAALVFFPTIPVQSATFTSTLITNLPPSGGAGVNSDPFAGAQMGAFYYFSATDGQNGTTGRELWKTDGTTNGTTLVKDINPGAADSSPSSFAVVGTNLFFVADDGTHGKQLWKSDGTPAGTVMVGMFSTN